MFCSISSKIRCLQNKCICFRQSSPMKRHNTNRRPRHTNLNCRHKRSMHKSPLQTYKESSFTYNKLYHSELLPIFYFSCMAIESTFTAYISPPHTCSISQAGKCHCLNSTSTSITMKKHYSRYGQPLNTLRC
jgi:hypothetical protein